MASFEMVPLVAGGCVNRTILWESTGSIFQDSSKISQYLIVFSAFGEKDLYLHIYKEKRLFKN